MRKFLFYYSTFSAAALLTVGFFASGPRSLAAVQHAGSLLSNGNFSQSNRQGDWPAGWGHPQPGLSWLTSRNGKHFLRLTSRQPDQLVILYRKIKIPVNVKAIGVTARFRVKNVRVGTKPWFDSRIIMHLLSDSGRQLTPDPHPMLLRERRHSTAWHNAREQILVPSGSRYMVIMPALFRVQSGTLDLRFLHILPLSAAAARTLGAKATWEKKERQIHAAAAAKRLDSRLAAQLAATGNLVVNGNFSVKGQAAWPAPWGKSPGISWHTSRNGGHFMRLSAHDPKTIVMLYCAAPLPTTARAIRITMRYRTTGVRHGSASWNRAEAIYHYLSARGHAIAPSPPAMVFADQSSGWVEMSELCFVPKAATALQIMPGLWHVKAGTLDVAKLQVRPLGPRSTAAMVAAARAQAKLKSHRDRVIARELARPPAALALRVSGNSLIATDGKNVWLQGVCVDSLEWSPTGEHILWSIHVAMQKWHANVIRLPILNSYWFGHGRSQKPGTQGQYRKIVDQAVRLGSALGGHIVIDLHRFGHPVAADIKFWKSVATRYKNNPAVIFELFNEPHGISWNIWLHGGKLGFAAARRANHGAVDKALRDVGGNVAVGMQTLLNTIRATGAGNIVAAGGLNWSYDLRGILHGYALHDPLDNVVYTWHVYPWKRNWAKSGVLAVAAEYPVFVTEVGCPQNWAKFTWVKPDERYARLGPKSTWAKDILGLIQKYRMNWTGFSFNPGCGPPLITGWSYAPTPYWGKYVKAALSGRKFLLRQLR